MKRAPTESWGPLATLLRSLEVGESGVLRVEVKPAPPEGWVLAPHAAKDHPERTWYSPTTHQRTSRAAPLRPGRYWVPERWRWAFINGLLARNRSGFQGHYLTVQFSDFGVLGYRRDWRTWFAPFPPLQHSSYEPSRTGVLFGSWRSPAIMPARAARLACEVGEERVEKWCPECGGEGAVPSGPPSVDDLVEAARQKYTEPCPSCLGSPGPWWVYDVERTEVE